MQTKSKITRVRTNKLTNETFFRFMTENRRYYENYNPQTLEIAGFMPGYDSALTELDDALERIRKSPDTERIAVLDADFDRTCSGMEAYVKAYLQHFDPVVRTAAENLDVVFRHYGNIGRRAYREELAASHNLVQELHARPADVNALQLAPWIAAHEAAAAWKRPTNRSPTAWTPSSTCAGKISPAISTTNTTPTQPNTATPWRNTSDAFTNQQMNRLKPDYPPGPSTPVETQDLASLQRPNYGSDRCRMDRITGYAANESCPSMNQVNQGSDRYSIH